MCAQEGSQQKRCSVKRATHAAHAFSPQLKIVLHYLGLSTLYTVNNQLSFYCLELADPGSMALGKSIAPYLCALLLWLNSQRLHALQWVCVIVQCCAIAIVQYDACKGTGYLPLKAYYMIGAATSITAVTSVWNQLIIKCFEVLWGSIECHAAVAVAG